MVVAVSLDRSVNGRYYLGLVPVFLLLLGLDLRGVPYVSQVALIGIAVAALWPVIREGEHKLAQFILGMAILLPFFHSFTGLPEIRPEELLLFFYLVYLVIKQDRPVLDGVWTIGITLAGFVGSTLLSILFATLLLDTPFSFRDLFELLKPVKYFLILLLVANANFQQGRYGHFLRCFWLFSSVFVVLGLVEALNLPSLDLLLAHYAPDGFVLSRLRSIRIMGMMGNPNYTGIFLMLVMSMSFCFMVTLKRRWQGLVWQLLLFNLAAMVLFLTMSRTALLAALVSLTFLCCRLWFGRVMSKRQLGVVVLVIAVIMAAYLGVAGDKFLWRFEAGLHLETSSSFQAKLGLWRDAWEYVKLSPILGWGPAKGAMTTLVDNEYLIMTRRYGLLGLGLYLAFYLAVFLTGGRLGAKGRAVNERVFGYALQGITLGFLVFNITAGTFYSQQLMAIYLTFAGVALSLLKKDPGRVDSGQGAGGEPGEDPGEDPGREAGPAAEEKGENQLVVLSHRFPTPTEPVKGIYVKEQLRGVIEGYRESQPDWQCRIISPVPLAPRILWYKPKWRSYGQSPPRGDLMGCPVFYIRHLVLPGAQCFFLQGFTMFLSLLLCRGKWLEAGSSRHRTVLHAHTILPDGLAAALLKKWLPDLKTLCTIHGSDILIFPERNLITRWLTRWALREMDMVVCVSEHLNAGVQKLLPRNVEVIPNGVDLRKFTLSNRDRAEVEKLRSRWPGKRLLVFVGNLLPAKGVREMLEAMVGLGDRAVLLMVGRPYWRQYVEEFIGSQGLADRIVVVGEVPHEQVKLWLAAADVFLLPSYSEGMPVALLEAMALGRPVVVTPVGGVPEVAQDGWNGLLVPPRDSKALEQAIKRILDEPGLAGFLGWNARSRVSERYTWAANAKQMLQIYSHL
ncbi:MAG TPA: glycosyltransferase [Bacillota bacterium]|nr:glycosyltransferase [Bacillota bacterium]